MTEVGVAGRRRCRLIVASPHRGGGLDSRDVRGGEYEQALHLLTQAHALFNASVIAMANSTPSTASAISPWTTPPAGDPRALFDHAHALARATGTAEHEAHALAGLGRCAHRMHDVPAATTTFTQALAICRRLGSPEIAVVSDYLASLRHDTDQHAEPT